jgi:hypothetical protein
VDPEPAAVFDTYTYRVANSEGDDNNSDADGHHTDADGHADHDASASTARQPGRW